MPYAKPRRGLTAKRIRRFSLLLAVLIVVAAHMPWIAQRVPRFAFPTLATTGAVLILFSFVNSLVQFVRRHRVEGRLHVLPVIVNGVGILFLALLPLSPLVPPITPSRPRTPRIPSAF